MTEGQQNNNSFSQKESKNAPIPRKDEEKIKEMEDKKKLLIEEKQPEEQLPVGEGHETEVIEENKE
jgi:hypothetical protein